MFFRMQLADIAEKHSLLDRIAKTSTYSFSLPLTDFGKNLTSTAAFAAHNDLVMFIICVTNFKLNRQKVSRATLYLLFLTGPPLCKGCPCFFPLMDV